MRCTSCQSESSRVIADAHGREACPNCVGISEAGGAKTSGSITRNAFRIRRQRDMHEGDFIQPHSYNKASRRVDVNPDFVKMYPDQAGEYFKSGEMVKAGYKKLPAHAEKRKAAVAQEKALGKKEISFEGNADNAMKKLLV